MFFIKIPPTQMSRKVLRFVQNEPHFIVYIAQRTNVNITSWSLGNILAHFREYRTEPAANVMYYSSAHMAQLAYSNIRETFH